MSNDLNKAELVVLVCEYEAMIDGLYAALRVKPAVEIVEKPGRKDEVLAILMTGKHVSVSQIARIVGISERNVSSQMSYLRKDGKRIATDSRGNKFLESDDAYKYRVLEHS